ncbi:MAG: hypothetical protein ABWY18_17140 [Tardiphaga sp.]
MLRKTYPPAAAGGIMGLAAVAILVIGTATPLLAAETRSGAAIHQPAATDIGAARRQHRARSASPRNAYGSFSNGAGATSSPGYGYGVGDNSRNQTW